VLPTTSPAVATPPADAAVNNEERQATIAQLRSLRSKYGTQLLELDRQAGPLLAEFNAVSKASDTPGPSEATGSGAEGTGSKLRLHPPKAYSDKCKAQRRMSAVFLDDVARYAKHHKTTPESIFPSCLEGVVRDDWHRLAQHWALANGNREMGWDVIRDQCSRLVGDYRHDLPEEARQLLFSYEHMRQGAEESVNDFITRFHCALDPVMAETTAPTQLHLFVR
jgi:hypothetical protein